MSTTKLISFSVKSEQRATISSNRLLLGTPGTTLAEDIDEEEEVEEVALPRFSRFFLCFLSLSSERGTPLASVESSKRRSQVFSSSSMPTTRAAFQLFVAKSRASTRSPTMGENEEGEVVVVVEALGGGTEAKTSASPISSFASPLASCTSSAKAPAFQPIEDFFFGAPTLATSAPTGAESSTVLSSEPAFIISPSPPSYSTS
mmetsp:Transcript_20823/g.43449  ORF Transcript_20823/g.43449 Transcript_20823/m.43449 type:complete len:203 (-) Transcript_20823:137-745(-)